MPIADVGAVTRFNLFGFLVGALALMVGLAGLSSPTNAPLGVLLLVIGVLLILASPKQAIEVLNSGGGAIRFPVSVLERSRTVEFANRVSEGRGAHHNADGRSECPASADASE